MNFSRAKISRVKLPFFIHKRNKGHADVVGDVSLEACGPHSDFSEILLYLMKYSKCLITPDTILEMTQEITESFKTSSFSLDIKFGYILDRISANYLVAPFELPCAFVSHRDGIQPIDYGMSISVPVQIKRFYNPQGFLEYTVKSPTTLYFEDLFDHVLQTCQTRIYPVISDNDRQKILDMIDAGRDPQEYLDAIKNQSPGAGGVACVRTNDVYCTYTMEVQNQW